jgi:hypothetical protein
MKKILKGTTYFIVKFYGVIHCKRGKFLRCERYFKMKKI